MKKHTLHTTALVISAVFLLASCKTLAVVSSVGALVGVMTGVIDSDTADSIIDAGEKVYDAAEDFTPENEYYIGRAVAASLLSQYHLYENDDATAYLNKIVRAITINSDKATLYGGYHVGILDTDEINAFATSGGHILVTRGLLACAQNEDALAAVLAHEIAHIQLKHNINAIKSSRRGKAALAVGKAGLSTAANLTGSAVLGVSKEVMKAFGDTISEGLSSMLESGYSKSNEYDADKKALSLMADAGYDPNAMDGMLTLLEQNQKKSKKSKHSMSKTHPKPKQRRNSLKNEYKKYNGAYDSALREARFNAVMTNL